MKSTILIVKDEAIVAAGHESKRKRIGYEDERDLSIQIKLALFKHEAEKPLREQRELIRVTLSSIEDTVIATDAGDSIAFINPVAASLAGWFIDEATGKHLQEVFHGVNDYSR